MEELPLGAQPFHHVHTFSAEEANIAASDVDREFFPERALQGGKKKSTESIFIHKWRETFKLRRKEKVILKPDAYIRSLQMFEGYWYYLQANDSKIQQFKSYSLVREGCLQSSSSPNYRNSLGKHTLQLRERRKLKCGKRSTMCKTTLSGKRCSDLCSHMPSTLQPECLPNPSFQVHVWAWETEADWLAARSMS